MLHTLEPLLAPLQFTHECGVASMMRLAANEVEGPDSRGVHEDESGYKYWARLATRDFKSF